MIPLNFINIFGNTDKELIQNWKNLLLKTINENKENIEYTIIDTINLMGLFLVLITRKDMVKNITEVVKDE